MNSDESVLYSRTAAGSPMGDLLRRYWLPALLSRELEVDGAPVRVRLLSEDLVAFRDTQGRIGLLREFCSHRGASLYYARNQGSALHCWYHGWTYDIEGRCLATPNEPPESRMRERIRQRAYPCVERNGMVWTYMGPPARKPELPAFEYLQVPDAHTYVSKRYQQCHWTQGMEGDLDPAHIGHLHGGQFGVRTRATVSPDARSNAWIQDGLAPQIEVHARPAGLLFAARRNADADTFFWRASHWFIPCFTTVPAHPGSGPLFGHAWVPADDTFTTVFTFTWHPQRPLTAEELKALPGGERTHPELIPGTFNPVANRAGEYARPGTPPAAQPWMRVNRIQDQDLCMTESIGWAFDREGENLGASDGVIARVRHTLLAAAQAVQAGGDPPGKDPAAYLVRPHSAQLRRDAEWTREMAEAMEGRPETYRPSV
jgi:phthalate 4,5-dioxygenase oxygenase subunit